ncbi:hypothetical protein B0H19DRAFT_1258157 [Mycena capillaripes]|nr:hypothetical protein B0H19DRAFT_1258157 [Mycena capillaripes]
MSHTSEKPHIVIIGAGIGGMTMAIQLKRIGFSNFTIIEKASEVGGTWRDNIYPGCSSDSFIHLYSPSTDLNPDWVHSHAFQPAIQEYLLQIALKYDLYSNIIFNRKVVSAQWDVRAQKYDIITEERDGRLVSLTASILVSAIGLLEVPKFPEIPGISGFRGSSFHSARWDNSVALAGKRVAVIGSGASATQHVPIISKDPSVQVTQFCRSPSWILPPVRTEYSNTQKWFLRHVPFYLRAFRYFHFIWSEFLYLAIFGNHTMNRYVEKHVKSYMTKATPAEYVDRVIPSHPNHKVGCKRVVYDTNYLASLARPNMSLVWDPIESINENGIVTKEGSAAFDVIIYSTGYVTDDFPVDIKGTDQTVAKYYRAQGGPTAYLGTTLPGFPNFFTICGANVTTGYTSVVFAEEVQVQYIIQMIKPVISGNILSMEVTAEATDTYNREIQRRLSGFIWAKCFSWYRTGNNGKIHGLFPGSMILYWWWMRHPNWNHYKVLTVARREPTRSIYAKIGVILGCFGMGVAGAVYLGRV